MKILFACLLILHGLVHLAAPGKLREPSDATGRKKWFIDSVLSRGVALLLFIAAASVFWNSNQWWLLLAATLLASQCLIVRNWRRAKYGTILNVVILLATIVGYAQWRFEHQCQRELARYLQRSDTTTALLTEQDIVHLPDPVKKYIRYTGSLNRPKISRFKVMMHGELRERGKTTPMPFTAVQYNFVHQGVRLFFLNATINHLPVAGFHYYRDGHALMDIRLLSLFNVQYRSGPEMDTAETVTFFNDLCCMAPGALTDPRIRWLEIASHKVKAAFTNRGITIYAWLYFDDAGRLVNFVSDNRYAATGARMMRLPWSTPVSEYSLQNGYRLPVAANAVYTYPEGDFSYGRFRIDRVEYNVVAP